MSNEDLDFAKKKNRKAALSSYWNYVNNVPQHLFKEEFLALQNLRKNKIVIQISDKVNSAVIVDKADYVDKNGEPSKLHTEIWKNQSKEWWNFEFCCQQRKMCWQH